MMRISTITTTTAVQTRKRTTPEISGDAVDLSQYDTVYIGYPIWWGTKPHIIDTFLDEYDLSGKKVMPFCTSGGSGIAQSVSEIKECEPDAPTEFSSPQIAPRSLIWVTVNFDLIFTVTTD